MKILFFLILVFISVDSWPLGGGLLREFGVRPSNFLLFIALILILIKKYNSKNGSLRLEAPPFKHLLYFFMASLALNILILTSNFLLDFINATQFSKGLLQFLMLIWFFLSVGIWTSLFKILKVDTTGYQYFSKAIIFCALINLAFFFLDFSNVNIAENFLILIRGISDTRPNGLSSEPSTYASWVLLIWPLLIFQKKNLISPFYKNISIIIGVLV